MGPSREGRAVGRALGVRGTRCRPRCRIGPKPRSHRTRSPPTRRQSGERPWDEARSSSAARSMRGATATRTTRRSTRTGEAWFRAPAKPPRREVSPPAPAPKFEPDERKLSRRVGTIPRRTSRARVGARHACSGARRSAGAGHRAAAVPADAVRLVDGAVRGRARRRVVDAGVGTVCASRRPT